MADIGQIAVFAAFVVCCVGAGAAVWAARKGAADVLVSARHATIALAALLVLASGVMITAFLTHDFSLAFVVAHSSRDMPKALVGAAFYSGMEGSLLSWATTLGLLGLAATITLWRTSRRGSR